MYLYAYIHIYKYTHIYIQLCEYRLGMLYKRTKKNCSSVCVVRCLCTTGFELCFDYVAKATNIDVMHHVFTKSVNIHVNQYIDIFYSVFDNR